jgi:cob(I)alamin adenosyltransferase
MKKGLVHVYTGNGKGKTTACLGLAMRAIGHGMKCCMIQFMKGRKYGENESAGKIGLEIFQYGRDVFIDRKNPDPLDIKLARDGWKHAKEIVMGGKYDLVILDCINNAMDYGLIDTEEVVELIKNKPGNVELVLEGRGAPQQIIELADYVTEMREVKHPYRKGILGRKGIEW